jgi:hypothetical protein
MATDPAAVVDTLRSRDDPRLDEEFWRVVPASDGTEPALVVGVVHDHPASIHRIRSIADVFDPGILALELPELVVPAVERSLREPEPDGGEMQAAVAACPDAEVVGIDSFGRQFVSQFVGNALAERASPRTLSRAVDDITSIVQDAVLHRLGRRDPAASGLTVDHDVTRETPAADQAADERSQVARSRVLLGAVERAPADLLLDETREQHMATRIRTLRRRESVLAVVGMDHLDAIATRLKSESRPSTE